MPHRRAQHRLPFIDATKALASQLIVLHHLCFYGPMSEFALPVAASVINGLADYGRLAVQVFLVIAGFLAARSTAPEGHLRVLRPGELILQRYVRLAAPLPFVVLFAVAGAALARQLMSNAVIPEPAQLDQIAAHLLLAHGVIGFDSLSAGIWYVAIDFQLFVLFVALMWLGHGLSSQRRERQRHPGAAFSLVLAGVSMFWFNRDADLDNWGIYFFASYALGAFAWWSAHESNMARHPRLKPMALVLVALTVVALVIDFRSRLALALVTAVILRYMGRTGRGRTRAWAHSPALFWLAEISYAVFLIHFSVLLVVSGVFYRYAPHTPVVQLAGMLLAWCVSIALGHLFHQRIELPVGRLANRLLHRIGAHPAATAQGRR